MTRSGTQDLSTMKINNCLTFFECNLANDKSSEKCGTEPNIAEQSQTEWPTIVGFNTVNISGIRSVRKDR